MVSEARQNGSDTLLSLYVNYPGEKRSISRDKIKGILSSSFKLNSKSKLFKLDLSVEAPLDEQIEEKQIEKEEMDWPLVIGVSIAGALLLILLIFSIIM